MIKKLINNQYKILIIAVVVMIMLQLLRAIFGYSLFASFSILPRSFQGLLGIFTSPWIHFGWSHLYSNIIPFIVMSFLLISRSLNYYLISSAVIILFYGAFVWLFGRHGLHAGASGWVFGLWSLLLANAFIRRQAIDFILSAVIFIYYGSIIIGIIPTNQPISFEGHLGGVIGGLVAAYSLRNKSIKN